MYGCRGSTELFQILVHMIIQLVFGKQSRDCPDALQMHNKKSNTTKLKQKAVEAFAAQCFTLMSAGYCYPSPTGSLQDIKKINLEMAWSKSLRTAVKCKASVLREIIHILHEQILDTVDPHLWRGW